MATALIAGVDLGGTKIQTVVMRGARVTGQARVLTPQTGAEDIVTAIAGTVVASAESAKSSIDEVAAIGVGSPGSIDSATGRVSRSPNVRGMEDHYDLGPALTRALGGKPVLIDNDVRVAVIGEHKAGAGRPYQNLLAVFLGTGVGGGLILAGKVHRGRGAAGEIGHTVVKDKGRECGCGRRGCLEAYASRGRMEVQARRLVDKGQKTAIFELMKQRGRDRLSSGVIAAALAQKDKMATRLVEEAAWALSISLSSVQNLLDLEAIIIGGGLGDRLGMPFIERVATLMKPHLFRDDSPPAMLTTELGDLSGAVGAAILAQAAALKVRA